jgi:pyruvate,orthophosphate dikinase
LPSYVSRIEASTNSAPIKYVYDFSEGGREMRDLLGGKGANVAEMITVLGAERVPAGFTITTEACRAFLRSGEAPTGLKDQIDSTLATLEEQSAQRLGDPADPLLVSVRSGAPVSMPGMMDTVLNLGLTGESVEGLASRTGNERFAWDSYRRFNQMFGNVVRGVPGARYEALLAAARAEQGVSSDAELDADTLQQLCAQFIELAESESGRPVPADPREQLREAIEAVFSSWETPRAIDYRRLSGIPDDLGTAANVQAMVFGNTGPDSGSGVAFTRDELTGGPTPSGDFLANAQGEDVVAGTRTTDDLDGMAQAMPSAHAELLGVLETLERHFSDMQDVEFTVEEGRLYLLQTRTAKRPAQAAVRFAVDAVAEKLLSKDEALLTIDADRLETLLLPTFDPKAEYDVLVRGVGASPGAAKGKIVLSASEAIARGEAGEDVILVRPFTEADDVAGFHAARGILTAEGGRASHAALVARGMGRPCVAGATDLRVNLEGERIEVGEQVLAPGDEIAIDGSAGIVTLDDVQLVEPEANEHLEEVLGWADQSRNLRVRANADTGEDAERSVKLGAEGIGLCRTEHMFFGADREGPVKEVFLAAERWRRIAALERYASERFGSGAESGDAAQAREEFQARLGELEDLQRVDFEALLEAMGSRPVTIRLLDPPLHEFLPVGHFELELAEADGGGQAAAQERLDLVRGLAETNPMIGTRGSRLGILYPQLYEMQVAALMQAAVAVKARGTEPEIEVMLPLIAYEGELSELRELVVKTADHVLGAAGSAIEYSVGTMIELPRSCLIAERIAAHADFFSFGTNDLTQTAIGLSRDDVEGRFIDVYIDHEILDRSPFEGLDEPGVGELVRIAAEGGRRANPDLHLGICGEHGGDPKSIAFFNELGLDYVSCSPIRVPVARLAAAQAAILAARE